MGTGKVTIKMTGGHQEGSEAQELLDKGIVDMSILDNAEVDKGEEVAGMD